MNLSLYITGLIGEPEEDHYAYDWITADDIKQEIDESEFDSIDLYINSVGGNAQHGFDMIKHIENTGVTPTVYIQGLAASMGSYIAAYFKNRGSKVYVYEDSEMMYHSARSTQGGTARQLFKMAESAEKLDDQMAEEYAKAFGKDKETVLDEMQSDVWLDAADLVDSGFAEFTENYSTLVAQARNEDIYNKNTNTMADYTKIAAALGKEVDSGESALVAAAKELKSQLSDLEAKLEAEKTEKSTLQAKLDKAEEKVSDLKKVAEQSEADKLIAKFENEAERKLSDNKEAQERAGRYALKAVSSEGTEKEDAEFALKSFIAQHGAPVKGKFPPERETDTGTDAYEQLKARCENEGISFEEGYKKYGLGGKK